MQQIVMRGHANGQAHQQTVVRDWTDEESEAKVRPPDLALRTARAGTGQIR